MSSRGWDFDRAMATITAVRPVASVNKGFERQLRAYAQVGYDVYAAQQVLLRNRIRGLHEMRGSWRKPSRSFRQPRDGRHSGGGGGGTSTSSNGQSVTSPLNPDRRKSDSFTSYPHSVELAAAGNGKGHKRYRPRLGLESVPSAGADTLTDPDDEEDDEDDEEYDEGGDGGGAGSEAKDAPCPEARVTLSVPRLHAAPALGGSLPAPVAYVDPKAPRCRLSRPGSTVVRVIPPLRGLERGFCCSFCGGGLFCLANVLRVSYSPPWAAASSSSNNSGRGGVQHPGVEVGRAPLHTSRARGGGGAKAFDFDFPADSDAAGDDWGVAPGKGSSCTRGPSFDTKGGFPSRSASPSAKGDAADAMDVDTAADQQPSPTQRLSGVGGGPTAMELDDDRGIGGDYKAAAAAAAAWDAKHGGAFGDESPRLPVQQREMLNQRHASMLERRPESAEKRRWLARMSLLATSAGSRPASGSERSGPGAGSERSPLLPGRPRSGTGGNMPQGVASPRLSSASQTVALSTGRPRSSSSAPAQLAAGVAKMARDDDEALRLAYGADTFAYSFDFDDVAGADTLCGDMAGDGGGAGGADKYLYVEYLDWMDPDGAILGTGNGHGPGPDDDRDDKPAPTGAVDASPPDPRGGLSSSSSSSSSPASPPLVGDKNSGEIRCRHCRREIGSWTWRPSPRQCLGGRLEAPLFRVHRGVVHLADVPLDATPLGTPRVAEPDGRPITPHTPKAPAKDDGVNADDTGRRAAFAK